jgi:hypothetical protein
MLVFSLRSSDSLVRSDSKLQTGLSSVFFRYLRNQWNGVSVYNEFIPREYTHNTIFIRNNTIQIQMTQMHAYALITHEDGWIHHSSNYSDILLASTITVDTTTITTYYYHLPSRLIRGWETSPQAVEEPTDSGAGLLTPTGSGVGCWLFDGLGAGFPSPYDLATVLRPPDAMGTAFLSSIVPVDDFRPPPTVRGTYTAGALLSRITEDSRRHEGVLELPPAARPVRTSTTSTSSSVTTASSGRRAPDVTHHLWSGGWRNLGPPTNLADHPAEGDPAAP